MREGWEYKKLGDSCVIEYGTRVVQKKDGGTIYPVYGGGGETFRMDKYNRENCLVVARFAMSRTCVRYVTGKFFLNDSGLSINAGKELLQSYLNHHILHLNDDIYNLGKGAAQRNLDVKSLRNLIIAIPPLSTQLSIVSELDKINELIRLKKDQLKDYDNLAQSIFYEMFGDPVANEKGWEVKHIGDFGTCIAGATPSTTVEEYWINGNAMVIHRKSEDLSFDFLKYLMLSLDYSLIITGAAQPQITRQKIAPIIVKFPSLSVQQSIVSELDKINELIRLKKEQLKDYDNLAQSIFYEMFGDPVVNEKGWEEKKLGDVCKFTQGTQVPIEEQHLSKENGLVQFLRIIDFTQGKDAPRFVKCSNDKYILHEREIAIVRYGTPGFVCYGKIGAIANNLFKITPNQKDMFEFEFLVHWLNTEAFQSAVKSKQYGAALQAIKFSTIQGINIIIPSLTVQRSFATRISQIDKQKKYIEESIKDLETLLASRMQYWFD